MTRSGSILIASTLLTLITPLAAADSIQASTVTYPAIQSRATQILVTFPDERESRLPVGNPASTYRRRGTYEISTWSKYVASQLAAHYGFKQVTQWPITALGVHCVVYELSAQQSVENVIRQLQQDNRVSAVQAMHTFRGM